MNVFGKNTHAAVIAVLEGANMAHADIREILRAALVQDEAELVAGGEVDARPGAVLLDAVNTHAAYWKKGSWNEPDREQALICMEQAVNGWRNAAYTMAEKYTAASNDAELERHRLAACGVAALGYFEGCLEEYKSASLSDVLKLREHADGLQAKLDTALEWCEHDLPLPEDEEIGAAHPEEGGDHETYAEALRMVSAKRSKGALVDLVNWLLRERHFFEQIRIACRRSDTFAKFLDVNFWSAHHVDLHWRSEGRNIVEQADWLSNVWYALRRHTPGRLPPASTMPVCMASGPLVGSATGTHDA